jgi:hypothetical protein
MVMPSPAAGLGLGGSRHRHVLLRGSHHYEAVLIAPPPLSAIYNPRSKPPWCHRAWPVRWVCACVAKARIESPAGSWIGTTFAATGRFVAASIKIISCQS